MYTTPAYPAKGPALGLRAVDHFPIFSQRYEATQHQCNSGQQYGAFEILDDEEPIGDVLAGWFDFRCREQVRLPPDDDCPVDNYEIDEVDRHEDDPDMEESFEERDAPLCRFESQHRQMEFR